MTRRDLLKSLTLSVPGAAYAQQMFHGASLPTMVFQTTATSFSPAFTKSGATLYWKWPDGTYTASNAPTKTLAAGTKIVRAQSQDGFNKVTGFNGYSQNFSGTLPSFAACTLLVNFVCHDNSFTDTLPSFATCTVLVNFYCDDNSFSNVVAGSFATQKSLSSAQFQVNALPASAVNQVLADFVVSLGISGRVVCNVDLSGGTNAAPTGQGIVDKATLISAGWTVTTT